MNESEDRNDGVGVNGVVNGVTGVDVNGFVDGVGINAVLNDVIRVGNG